MRSEEILDNKNLCHYHEWRNMLFVPCGNPLPCADHPVPSEKAGEA